MNEHAPGNPELRRFYVESAELLGEAPLLLVAPDFADQQSRHTRVYNLLGDDAPESVEATGDVQVEVDTKGPQPRIIVWAAAP